MLNRLQTCGGWLTTLALVWLFVASPFAQPLNTQIQIAINRLTTGITPFTQLTFVASSYANWGGTLGTSGYGIRDNAGVIEAKSSGGAWTPILGGAGAPVDATFWVRTADGTLNNETVMGVLGTGLVINTTTTGVPTIYAGASCTNQFVEALSAIGAATCSSVALTTDVTGTLPVANGGTGFTSGTSGGVPYFSAVGVLASSALLTANQLIVGGGAGSPPVALGSAGTSTTVLHGDASGTPTFGAVDLTTDVTDILPSANGGTDNAFFSVTGPATSTKTYTFPNASTTILTTNTAVTAAQGGTGLSSYTTGDLLYASGAAALSALAGVGTGNALIAGGVSTAPSWGKIGLTTHISGTLGPANGGTGIATYTIGDLLYATGATSLAKLTDVAVGQVLVSGGVAAAPAWSATPQLTSVSLGSSNVTFSGTAPTVSSGFGTSPTVAGTATAFRVDVGTGGTATAGVLTMPSAATAWNCHVENLTGTLGNYANQRTVQLSSTTTTVTIENQTISTGAALAWTASDIVALLCAAY